MECSSHNILLVEDDVIVSDQIRYYLENIGHQVFSFYDNFEEAIQLLKSKSLNFDIAILDINLGREFDGIELGSHFSDKYDVPVLFITGESKEVVINDALDISPVALLRKPFSKSELEQSLQFVKDKKSLVMKNNKKFFLELDSTLKALDVSNLLFAVNTEYGVQLQFMDHNEDTELTLSQLQEQLSKKNFVRCHRDFLVNGNYVRQFDRTGVEIGNRFIPSTMQAYKLFSNL